MDKQRTQTENGAPERRDSFVIYRSQAEALAQYPADIAQKIFRTLAAYALDGIPPEPADLNGDPWNFVEYTFYQNAFPLIDSNRKRYERARKGGKARGARTAPDADGLTALADEAGGESPGGYADEEMVHELEQWIRHGDEVSIHNVVFRLNESKENNRAFSRLPAGLQERFYTLARQYGFIKG